MGQPFRSPDYQTWVTLLDGHAALVRQIRSSDYDELRSFFGRLGPETMFLRFHYAKPVVPERELRSYCECDSESTYTLIAQMERRGRAEIVGVGRYDRLPDGHDAEVAFVVEDKEQGNGIGTHLLAHLAIVAKEKGLVTFIAETVTYNEIMLSIFRKYDQGLRREVDGDSCRVTFSIAPSRGSPSPSHVHAPPAL
jgi:GNAT superfamily N-acetyltransferase